MKSKTNSQGRRHHLILAAAAGSVLGIGVLAQASTYTWTSASAGGNWSGAGNWTANDGGTPPPTAGDTANLNDATANRTITYDSGSSGSLGTLSMTQTDPFTNLLDVNRSLSITNAVTLGATGGGTSQYFSDPVANSSPTDTFSGGLTLNSGGVLELESYQSLQSGATLTSQSTIGGNVTINGGTLFVDQSVSPNAGAGLAMTLNNNLSMSSGMLSIGVNGPAGNALAAKTGTVVDTTTNRLTVVGNLSLTGGSVLSSTTANNIWVEGSSATIGTLSTSVPVQLGLVVNSTTIVNQTLASDSSITGGLLFRNLEGGVASVNDSIGSLSGGTLSLGSGTLSFQNSDTTGAIKVALTSNVTAGATPIFQGTAASTQSVTIDTAGNTLNLGTAAESLSATGANGIAWNFLSSTGNGTFEAASFDLSGSTVSSTVGSNLTLDATGGGGTTNTLSNTHGGTISPSSTFAYAGSATPSNFAKLVSTRTIGNLAVNSGALQLGGPITTGSGSVTTVGNTGTLDLGGTTLTTTSVNSSGVLGGSGSFVTTGGVTSSGTFSPGETGTVGSFNLAGSGLTLSSSDNAVFDVASTSSFDTVLLNNLDVSYGGTLTVSFASTPSVGTTYAIFENGDGSSDFSSIATNLPADEMASFDPSDGVLSIIAVPEPTAISLLGITAFGLLGRRRRKE